MYKKSLSTIILMTLLTGCGGGGGSSAPTVSTLQTTQEQTAQTPVATEPTPMQLHLTALGDDEVVLSWESVPTATHYVLYHSQGEESDSYDAVSVDSITYTHQVSTDTVYRYHVIAMLDDQEISLPSMTLAVKVSSKDDMKRGGSDIAP